MFPARQSSQSALHPVIVETTLEGTPESLKSSQLLGLRGNYPPGPHFCARDTPNEGLAVSAL